MSHTWIQIQRARTCGRKLNFYALQNAFVARVNTLDAVVRRSDLGSSEDLLDDSGPAPRSLQAPPVPIVPSDATLVSYIYHHPGAAQMGEVDDDDFAENDDELVGELDFRHPGTHLESDDEDERCSNERFAPLRTLAARWIAICSTGHGGTVG